MLGTWEAVYLRTQFTEEGEVFFWFQTDTQGAETLEHCDICVVMVRSESEQGLAASRTVCVCICGDIFVCVFLNNLEEIYAARVEV